MGKMYNIEKFPPNPKNWQRQKCDTNASWAMFQQYLQLKHPRRMKDIPGVKVKKNGKVSTHYQKWCASKAWVSRAEHRDLFLAKEKDKRLAKKREMLIQKQEEADVAARDAMLDHVEQLSMSLVAYALGQVWEPSVKNDIGEVIERGKLRNLNPGESISSWQYKATVAALAICGVSAKTQIEITDGNAIAERPDISKFEGMTIEQLTKMIFEERK